MPLTILLIALTILNVPFPSILFKQQSAMEFLMTYGWAILIIAVVLSSLFSLGVFNAGSSLPTACVAIAGYTCSSPSLHLGNFIVTLGQATGVSWTGVTFYLVAPGGTTSTCPPTTSPSTMISNTPTSTTVTSSTSQIVYFQNTNSLTAYTSSNTIGGTLSGTIWAQYTASGTSSLCAQMAKVTMKAT